MNKFKNKKIFNILVIALSLLIIFLPVFLFLYSCHHSENSKNDNLATDNFLHNNSVSLLQVYDSNNENITKLLNKFYDDNKNDSNFKNNFSNFSNVLTNFDSYSSSKTFNLSLGTGWVFDYSYDENENLISYYLATNDHVLDTTIQLSNKIDSNTTIDISIPINSYFVNEYNLYFSQPLENKPIVANISDVWEIDWYNTNINTIEKFANSVLPIGQLPNNGTINPIETAKKFVFKLTVTNYSSKKNIYYVYYDNSTDKLSYINSEEILNQQFLIHNVESQDFQIIKLQSEPNKMIVKDLNWINQVVEKNPILSSFVYSSIERKEVYENLTKMFNFNKEQEINNDSSFINRLEYLIYLVENNLLMSDEFKEWFLFYDYKDLKKAKNSDITQLAGFPGISEVQNINENKQLIIKTKYSCATILTKNIDDSPLDGNNYDLKRLLEQNYKGNLVLSDYDYKTNCLLPSVDLQSGSSGSMVLVNNKIMGIYWGILTKYAFVDNNLVINKNGVCTPIFNSDLTQPSIVNKYLKFISSYDSNSRLLYLFKKIYNIK